MAASSEGGYVNPSYDKNDEDALPPSTTAIDVGVDPLFLGSPKHARVAPTNDDVRSIQGTSAAQDAADARAVETCGYSCWTPLCLRRFATGRSFVFFCSILSLSEAGLTIGYISSAVTSIEKHFNFNSTLTGFVISCYDIGTLLVILTSYYGGRPTSNRPKWIAWSAWTMTLGACIVPMSHFITGDYSGNKDNSTDAQLCHGGIATPGPTADSDPECDTSRQPVTMALAFLIPGMLLIGVGSTSMFTLGTTYIEDHVRMSESPILLAIFFCTTVIGPAVGFGIGFLVLGLYVDFNTVAPEDVMLTPNDTDWVGAWWLGFFICAAMIAIPAIPVYAFPATLPKPREEMMGTFQEDNVKPVADSNDRGQMMMSFNNMTLKQLPRAIFNLFKNPVYMIINIASAVEFSIVSGFVRFSPKFIQYQFNLTASTANLVTGTLVPTGAIGVIIGGVILNRVKRDLMTTINVLCFFTILSGALYGFLYIPEGCTSVPLAGVNTPYVHGSSPDDLNLTSSCNALCSCDDLVYTPVCGSNDVKYFSPCHAGCSHQREVIIVGEDDDSTSISINYENCSCINSYYGENSSQSMHMKSGFTFLAAGGDSMSGSTLDSCTPDCNAIIPFIIILLLVVCVTSVVQMPALMTILRSVKMEERPFGLGMQFVIIRLLGYIPSPIYFGAAIDSTCILWQTTCGNRRGSCLEYDNERYFNTYLGLCTGLKMISVCMAIICWVIMKRRTMRQRNQRRIEESDTSSAREMNLSNGGAHSIQHPDNSSNNGIAVITSFKMLEATD